MQRIGLFIGGDWRSDGGDWFASINPATERPLAQVRIASAEDVDDAVKAARSAFHREWRRLPAADRAWYLRAIADAIEARQEELAAFETADTGMTLAMTRGGHLPRTVEHFRYFAEEATRTVGEVLPLDDAYLTLVQREPLGVVAVLAPWNAPLAVASINAAAALAAGNCVILKPSERSPLTSALLADIIAEVGLPAGVFSVLQGPGEPTGAALASHPGVDGICFVGGTAAGRRILASAAAGIKRTVLELGGKSPTVVLADADLEAAVDGALLSVFASNGEVCTAGSRIIVETGLHDAFLEAFVARTQAIRVGDPTSSETEVGPLIDHRHWERVSGYVTLGTAEGARLACGGARPADCPVGYYLQPAVFAEVDPGMRIAREEIFGPVAAVIRAADAAQAIAFANDSPFGLSATVWTGDLQRGLGLAQEIAAGSVAVNTPLVRDIRAPFGGMKQSGLGRVGGRWSLEQFSEIRTTCLPVAGYALPRFGVAGRR